MFMYFIGLMVRIAILWAVALGVMCVANVGIDDDEEN